MLGKLLKRRSFFTVILLSNIVMLIVPLTIAIISYSSYSKVLTDQVAAYHTNVLRQTERVLEERLSSIEQLTLGLSQDPLVRRFLNVSQELDAQDRFYIVKLNETLSKVISSNSYITGLYIYFNRSGLVVTSSSIFNEKSFYNQAYAGSAWKYEDFKTRLINRHILEYSTLLTMKPDAENNRDVLSIMQSVNFTGKDDGFATIVVLLDAEKLKTLFQDISKVDEGAVYLLDSNNQVLLSLGNQDIIQAMDPNKLDLNVANGILKGSKKDRELLLFTVSTLSQKRQYISTIIKDGVMADVNSSRMKFILLSLSMMLLSLIIAYWVARSSYKPVKALILGLRQKASIDHQGKNELEYIERFTEKTLKERDNIISAMQQQLPILRSNLLTHLVKGNLFPEELYKYSPQSLGVDFPFPGFCFILIQIDEFHSDKWDEKNFSKFVIGNVLEYMCESFGRAYVIDLEWDRIGLLLNVAPDIEDPTGKINEVSVQATDFIKNKFSNYISVAIGNIHDGVVGASISFREAVTALDYQTIQGVSTVSRFREMDLTSPSFNYVYSTETESALIQAIKQGDAKKTNRLLEEIFLVNLHQADLPLQWVRCLFFDLMSTAIKVLNHVSIQIDTLFCERNPYDELMSCRNIKQMEYTLQDIFGKICEHMKEKRISRNESLRDSILTYMQENYRNPNISLTLLANVFQLNPTYLSNLFKEQMGDNFMSMLNTLRLNAVKEVLIKTTTPLQEIALQVGYSNSAVLIRNFKKVEGVTPGEYRERFKTQN